MTDGCISKHIYLTIFKTNVVIKLSTPQEKKKSSEPFVALFYFEEGGATSKRDLYLLVNATQIHKDKENYSSLHSNYPNIPTLLEGTTLLYIIPFIVNIIYYTNLQNL